MAALNYAQATGDAGEWTKYTDWVQLASEAAQLDEAKAGDAMALEVVETVGRYLGLMMAQIAMTVDPEMFVIGGGVSKAGQFLIDIIEKYFEYYTPISKNKGKVGLAKLGNDAGIYGAARLVLD